MKHVGLFEGIGGFSLAGRWAGWETEAWCEIDPFCQKVLSYHFPEATGHGDIKTTDFTIYGGRIDIVTGGFPCQPYSAAGKRLGKQDDRHLWPEMLRAIREIQPTWVVGENVRGLTNWNKGVVFDEVQADLEALGYEVQSFILPACAVNAPHRRDRVWIVAFNANSRRCKANISNKAGQDNPERVFATAGCTTPDPESGRCRFCAAPYSWQATRKINTLSDAAKIRLQQLAPDTGNKGLQRNKRHRQDEGENSAGGKSAPGAVGELYWRPGFDQFPTKPPVCRRDDGFPGIMDSASVFRELGIEHPRQPAIGFAKWRSESIKAYGNAIVPQVAYQIFKTINQIGDE